MSLTPEQWQHAKHLLPEAMRLSPDERRHVLGHEFSEAAVVEELLQMLALYDTSSKRLGLGSLSAPRPFTGPAEAGSDTSTDASTDGDGDVTLNPGDVCGRYRVVKLLGRGGMGQVYVADDTDLGGQVALKVLRGDWLNSPDAHRRLRDEARRAAALRGHPHVATIFHILDESLRGRRTLILVMEYVEGRSASSYTSRGPVPARRALAWARDVANAVAFAHDRGILHCDLKPGNIQITEDDRAKVLDFGLARVKFEPLEPGRGLMGTPAYMAPEQLSGREPDERVDIYAIGVTLFELLTGRHPYDAETWPDLFVEMQSPALPRASALLSAVPADAAHAIDAIVERAMAREPRRRFQSAREMEQAIDGAIALVERSSPAARVTSHAMTAARVMAAAFVSVMVLGFVASQSLDQGLQRTAAFGRTSPWSWPGWGLRSLVAPAAFAALLAVVGAVVVFMCRLALAVPALGRLCAPMVSRWTSASRQLAQLSPSTLAHAVLTAQVIVLGLTLWYFWPFVSSMVNFVTGEGPVGELRPGRGGMHTSYMLALSAQAFVFGLLWYHLFRTGAGRQTRDDRLLMVAAVAALGITLFFLTVRYRVRYQNESERVVYDSNVCYDVGTDGTRTLLFCPQHDPRTLIVGRAAVTRTGIVENIFTPLDSRRSRELPDR